METTHTPPPPYCSNNSTCGLTPLANAWTLEDNNFTYTSPTFAGAPLKQKVPLSLLGPIPKRKRSPETEEEDIIAPQPPKLAKMSEGQNLNPANNTNGDDVDMPPPPPLPTRPPYGYIDVPAFGNTRLVYADPTKEALKTLPQDTPLPYTPATDTKTTINGRIFDLAKLSPNLPHGNRFPRRYLDNRDLYAHLSRESLVNFNKVFGPRLLITIAHAPHRRTFSVEGVEELKSTVKSVVAKDVDPQVHPSELTEGVSTTAPQPWLVNNIPKAQVLELISRGHVSFNDRTLYFDPVPHLPPSPYVMTIVGFTLPISYANKTRVATTVENALLENLDFVNYFAKDATFRDLVPEALQAGEPKDIARVVAQTIVASGLKVTKSWGNSVQWHIYIQPPTSLYQALRDFYNIIRSTVFTTGNFGIGRAKDTDPQCGACQSRDHKTAYCPFKLIPGYFDNDPKPSCKRESKATPNANADNDEDNMPTTDFDFDVPINNNHHR